MINWQRSTILFFSIAAVIGAWFGIAAAGDQLPVVVSILPQKTFVEKIGGDRVAVSVMVQPGASPATYEPKPGQMARLSKARAYFAVGVPFEKVWLPRIAGSSSQMKIVHTDRGIRKIPMAAHGHTDATHHRHDAESPTRHHRESGIPDPHIWLSPPLVRIQAHAIMTALGEIDPENRAAYAAGYERFAVEIDALDADIRNRLAEVRGLHFMVFHPSWGYFADTYGLHQIPIEVEGKAPKPARLMALVQYARKHHVRVIFVQPQFSRKSAETIADAIGARLVAADPLASDWAESLKMQANNIREAVQ